MYVCTVDSNSFWSNISPTTRQHFKTFYFILILFYFFFFCCLFYTFWVNFNSHYSIWGLASGVVATLVVGPVQPTQLLLAATPSLGRCLRAAFVYLFAVPLAVSFQCSASAVGRTVASSQFSALRVPDLNATPPAAFTARRPPPTSPSYIRNPNIQTNVRAVG